MFSGFQNNAFQNNAFQILLEGTTPPPEQETGGHFGQDYRKRIERLERITRTKEITAPVIAAAQDVIEAAPDIVAPQLAMISQAPDAIAQMAIDYDALALEIKLIENYLSGLSLYGNMIYDQMNELDDELAILLMVN